MHTSSLRRMKWFSDTFLEENKSKNILDVGSYNVNGCYREIFDQKEFSYTGLDMEDGPNVDIVPKAAYEWKEISDDEYDVVISGQALEHIEFFWVTMSEIVRVTKKGGLICIVAPNGFAEHRYPVDCWRFFTDGMVALARYNNLEILHAHTNSAPNTCDDDWYSEDCSDSMLVARKPYSGRAETVDLSEYKCTPINHKDINNGMKTYKEHLEYKTKQEIEITVDCKSEEEKLVKPKLTHRMKKKIKGFIKNWI